MDQWSQRLDGVFEGGGIKGIALVGAAAVVEQAGYEFVNLAGPSAGAIVAALLGVGYSADELRAFLLGFDFTRFLDPPPLGRLPVVVASIDILARLGLYQGDAFLNWMRERLDAKGVRTFRDLLLPGPADKPRYRLRVRLVDPDITRGRMVVLPQDITAYGGAPEDLEVALAVRMCMGIPLFYMPVPLRNPGGATSNIVDGGLLSNFPVELFDALGHPAWANFGFKLVNPDQPETVRYRIQGPLTELVAMFDTAMEARDAFYLARHKFVRTITIDDLGISATQFDLAHEQKEALYASGAAGARDFLAHWDFESYQEIYRSGRPVPRRLERLSRL